MGLFDGVAEWKVKIRSKRSVAEVLYVAMGCLCKAGGWRRKVWSKAVDRNPHTRRYGVGLRSSSSSNSSNLGGRRLFQDKDWCLIY